MTVEEKEEEGSGDRVPAVPVVAVSSFIKSSITCGEYPSAVIFCRTAPSGNISFILRYFCKASESEVVASAAVDDDEDNADSCLLCGGDDVTIVVLLSLLLLFFTVLLLLLLKVFIGVGGGW